MTTLERLQRDARRCHAAALAAVEPGRLVARALGGDGQRIALADADGRTIATHRGRVYVLAVGKGAAAMMRAASARLGSSLARGLAVLPPGSILESSPNVRVLHATHPVPTAASVRAGRAALALAREAGPDTLLLVLLSGGASSLLAVPAPGLTLADKRAVTRLLLRAGADIAVLNTVRRHCSAVKGGGLLRAAVRAAGVWTLALSDVLGDDLTTIGSGPTVAERTSARDALAALERFDVLAHVPVAVRRHLEASARKRRAKKSTRATDVARRSHAVVVGNNATAVAAAMRESEALGYATTRLPDLLGDAAACGRALAARLSRTSGNEPCALIAGGEPTVRVVAKGRGGRAQHLALAAALELDHVPTVVLAAGTDGIDGPTDAAGALVDQTLVRRARRRGVDLHAALRATDSHPALDSLGALLRTGPTGTNVADLVVALRAAC